ncbi:MAG TPA: M1 family metallopeptidase [Chthoniobacterales bacterium]|nr:M1 family metallopeptidase [Chthoniobacterales bacterium]
MRFWPFACFATFLIAAAVPLRAEKPFDFDSTPGKLPKQVVPTEYAIRLTPNLEAKTFTGTAIIKIKANEPVQRLVLNALELEISSAVVDEHALEASAIKLDKKQELLTLVLPSELSAGQHAIGLTFRGKINQQGQGLFYASYQEHGTGAKKNVLGTQFEPTDARRLFPCWDEPIFRARFQLTVVIPRDWVAVSNMPVEAESEGNLGKEIRFAMSPPMSSYLNVLAAGELEFIETQVEGVQLRVVTTKGKGEFGRYALESSAKILQYYNEYFGVPYPLPKLDHIALPGGFGGAMENWGGITYFESILLFDPEKNSDQTKHDIFAVIAHEMAHMWFGDLVTMAWWDNLWLNEGFASWMGTKCTDHFNPQWQVWLRTDEPRNPARPVGISQERAMERDARSTTHPIQQPISTETEANSAFDDITYQKGQSFIRMLESFLGEETFRDGMRRYMTAHQYSNTTTADLWSALSQASGKPVNEIAAGWTEQPGLPIVKVRRDEDGKVGLFQERFAINYKHPRPFEWKIPLTYAALGQAPATKLMTARNDVLEDIPADQPFKLNLNGAGYYRVQYDPRTWDQLVGSFERLSLADRVNLLNDAWALVQANRAPLSMYTSLVAKLPPLTELPQWDQVMNIFDQVDQLLIGQPGRDMFQQYARSILKPIFDQVGWDAKPDESSNTATLRAHLVDSLGGLGDPDVISGCRDRLKAFLADPKSLPPDMRRPVLAVAARDADQSTWDALHDLGMKTTVIAEKQDCYDALAHARDPKLIQKTLATALTDELSASRASMLPLKVARESEHPELVWAFAKANMKVLLGKTDSLGATSYAPSQFMFFSDRARINELKAYAKASLPASAAPEVAKAVDQVEFRSDFKKRLAAQLEAALQPNEQPIELRPQQ